MGTLLKGRARRLSAGVPRMSEWERHEQRERATAAGFRLDEECDCAKPRPGFGGGSGFYVTNVCVRCSRRLRGG